MAFLSSANDKVSRLLDIVPCKDPLSKGDIEAAVWPVVAKASVKDGLPNWVEVRVSDADARSGCCEDIANLTAEAIEGAANAAGLDAGGITVICSVDHTVKVGRISMACDSLPPSALRRRQAVAKAGGSVVVSCGKDSTRLVAKCLWDGSVVELSSGTTVGRIPVRDVVLKCYGASRFQGVFASSAKGIRFIDKSTNGTELNGVRISGTTWDLAPGDRLTFAGADTLVVLEKAV